jgi:thioredoxin 1
MSSVLEIDDRQFEQEVFAAGGFVLAYFWAPWCGPCRLVSPSINSIAQTYSDRLKVVKLEVDANPNAVAKCQVEGVPALRLFQGGKIIASHEGAIGKQQLQAMLDSHL